MSKYTINKDLTILDALVQIEGNHHRSLIVVNESNKVVGSLSDGDIRRALINGMVLPSTITKIMNLDYLFVNEGVEDSKIKSILSDPDVFLLPCINSERKLIDLHVKR
jgi:CBS domain-containing protein